MILNIKKIIQNPPFGKKIKINGWVRSFRNNRFIIINDGSTIDTLQAVIGDNLKIEEKIISKIANGASISIDGEVIKSIGKQQEIEIKIDNIDILGECDADTYPIQPKKHSLEFLREMPHMRCKTNLISSVMRIRHHISMAIHDYFNKRDFFYIHTPIITSIDCEGAGEMFTLTSLNKFNARDSFKDDFFGKHAKLTVSGQLHVEAFALAMKNVYTFGPTFRSENSNTSRHLSEFWMIEPEMAFVDIEGNMKLAEDFIKNIISYIMKTSQKDLQFLNDRMEKEELQKPKDKRNKRTLLDNINFVLDKDFKRVSYTEAIDILKRSKPNKNKKFKFVINDWGANLQSEHEKYLVEKHFDCPVIIYDFPSKIKAFYMKENEDKRTVKAMDILFPSIGEIIGGSQREENIDVLRQKMDDFKINKDSLKWYLDLRLFGGAVHSGFGLGLERIIQFLTGISNIRDVIPYPRSPKNLKF